MIDFAKTTKIKHLKMPHTLVILFLLIIVASIATWVVPSGEYNMIPTKGTSRLIIDPSSYHAVDKNPANLLDVFVSIPLGLQGSAMIIFMILISSGTFALFNATGAINRFIGVLLKKAINSKVPSLVTIGIVFVVFSCMGLVIGPEILIPFTTICVSIALGLGYDLIVGLALVVAAGGIGFCMGPVCASTIGTADAISGLPLFSGMGFRTIIWIITTLIAMTIVLVYAKKVKNNPTKSYVYGVDITGLNLENEIDTYHLEKQDIGILLIFFAMFISMIIGPIAFGWYLNELSGAFVITAILVALMSKITMNEAIKIFADGAGKMFIVAMMVGMGRSIQVILENGHILHTIINVLSDPISRFSPFIAAVMMTLVHTVINFFIPSGSGQAAVSMPIMFPLGTAVGLTNQISILAFQIGDGFSNMMYPTLGSLMAMCGLARVPFGSWLRMAIKIVVFMTIVGWVFLWIAIKINWGPF